MKKLEPPFFIYLDSKIIGAALQIVSFFDNQVFMHQNTTVLIKKYKHQSSKIIKKIFKKSNIKFAFVTDNDLDNITSGTIFYPFNAQSNCRAVSNRNLLHIFITHGESNKISSIKPIIRIYDHVITAGQMGIERYLKNNIFSTNDIACKKVIPMGDTFIGKTGLSPNYQPKTNNGLSIFYAPTWEGGIEKENYSSLENSKKIAKLLLQAANRHKVNHIVIKPHPNTAHRLKKYYSHLFIISQILTKKNINITLYKPYCNFSLYYFYKFKKINVNFVNHLIDYQAVFGFCDISAVETQLLNENIPYFLLLNRPQHRSLLNLKHYQHQHIIDISDNKLCLPQPLSSNYYQSLKQHFIHPSICHIPIHQRLDYLANHILT